jgi:hypothetical protein
MENSKLMRQEFNQHAREDRGEYWLLTTATPKLYQEHARFLLGAHGTTFLCEYNYFHLVV